MLCAGFTLTPQFREPWCSVLLPIPWNAEGDRGWEEGVRNLYRNDDAGTMQTHQAGHRSRGDVLAGNELDFIHLHGV